MNDAEPAEEEEVAEPLAGERLADARRSLDLSVVEVAKALHLDEHKVVALEANKFDVVGPPVFAKGHMRKYAELVGVPVETVLADYYTLNRSAAAPPVVGPKRKYARDISLAPWIAGFIVVAAVGLAAWWWSSGTRTATVSEPPAETAAPQMVQPTPEPAAGEPVAADSPTTATEITEERPETAVEQELTAGPLPQEIPEAVPSADVVAGENTVQLRLTYSGDCWTELTDATGRNLFFDLGRSGRVINVSGEAPLRLLLGDSTNVRVQVNGADYDLPPTTNVDNTLFVTIDGL